MENAVFEMDFEGWGLENTKCFHLPAKEGVRRAVEEGRSVKG